jgi:hypothetical protein
MYPGVSGGGYAAGSVLADSAAAEQGTTRAERTFVRLGKKGGYLDVSGGKVILLALLAIVSAIFTLSPLILLCGQAAPLFDVPFPDAIDRYLAALVAISTFIIGWAVDRWRQQSGSAIFYLLSVIFWAIQVGYWADHSTAVTRISVVVLLCVGWIALWRLLSTLPDNPGILAVQRKARFALVFIGLLTFGVVLQLITQNMDRPRIASVNAYFYGGSLAILGLAMFANPNRLNPALRIYHEGLANTFGGGNDAPFCRDQAKPDDPIHMVNCFVQSPGSDDPVARHCGGENFCVSRFHVGCKATGYFQTKRWFGHRNRRRRAWIHQHIWRLIATSGAALDAHPIRQSPVKNAIFSAFNIGLGAWVINPNFHPQHRNWWPQYFMNFISTLNEHSTRAKWLRLSDGGHFENLGLYELVARECSEIIVVDGAHDPDLTFSDLAIASQRCWEDFGARIEIPGLFPTRSAEARLPETAVFTGTIRYENSDKPGKLTYIKLLVTSQHSTRLRLRPSMDARFPHEPTSNQFSTREFADAYFSLGYESAQMIPRQRPSPTLDADRAEGHPQTHG